MSCYIFFMEQFKVIPNWMLHHCYCTASFSVTLKGKHHPDHSWITSGEKWLQTSRGVIVLTFKGNTNNLTVFANSHYWNSTVPKASFHYFSWHANVELCVYLPLPSSLNSLMTVSPLKRMSLNIINTALAHSGQANKNVNNMHLCLWKSNIIN